MHLCHTDREIKSISHTSHTHIHKETNTHTFTNKHTHTYTYTALAIKQSNYRRAKRKVSVSRTQQPTPIRQTKHIQRHEVMNCCLLLQSRFPPDLRPPHFFANSNQPPTKANEISKAVKIKRDEKRFHTTQPTSQLSTNHPFTHTSKKALTHIYGCQHYIRVLILVYMAITAHIL